MPQDTERGVSRTARGTAEAGVRLPAGGDVSPDGAAECHYISGGRANVYTPDGTPNAGGSFVWKLDT